MLLQEALEIVRNIPKKANDICHYNYIDVKDKEKVRKSAGKKYEFRVQLIHAGPLVMQDALQVWTDSRTLIRGKGKERQVRTIHKPRK